VNASPPDGADALRSALRGALVSAMKARDADAAAALRTAIAAIDNAQAVAAPDDDPDHGGEHVAGARVGLGAAEAPRRGLSPAEADTVLGAVVAEQDSAAATFEALGRAPDAARLRRQSALLSVYLRRSGDASPPGAGPRSPGNGCRLRAPGSLTPRKGR
jgi:uncharacterized protein